MDEHKGLSIGLSIQEAKDLISMLLSHPDTQAAIKVMNGNFCLNIVASIEKGMQDMKEAEKLRGKE